MPIGILDQETPKIMFNKKKEELCVAQLLNGLLIIGEDGGDKIENPISFSYQQEFAEYDENGMPVGKPLGTGFRTSPVGDPNISRKAIVIEGVPEIKKFVLSPIPKSMCMICHNLKEIEIGGHLFNLYAEVMTKISSPTLPNMKNSIIQR
jgi:hypothetical protein